MELILEGIVEAFRLLFGGDANVYQIMLRSLWVSGLALLIASLIGLPLGVTLGLSEFRGRHLTVATVNAGMGVPPVVVGLLVSLLLSRNGMFGFLRLLYTNWAMVVAQVLIALPLVTGLSLAAVQQLDPGFRLQIVALGAGRLQAFWLLLKEIWVTLLAAVMAAFGGIISEVGAVMMVGGNIRGQTQVLTTGVVEETRAGRFATAIALSIILLMLVFAASVAMTIVQQRGRRHA
jgi:tungstate transport system permease protein